MKGEGRQDARASTGFSRWTASGPSVSTNSDRRCMVTSNRGDVHSENRSARRTTSTTPSVDTRPSMHPAIAGNRSGSFQADPVIHDFLQILETSKEMTIAVAAVKVLTGRIESTSATTVMELHKELSETASRLQQAKPSDISLKTACDLFLHYVARGRNVPDFDVLKKQFIDRGNAFAEMSFEARQAIARHGLPFIEHGKTILVHGYSRVVVAILKHAAGEGVRFHVVLTEGRPNGTGIELAKILEANKISATVVLDSGVGYMMDRVDCVLVGAGGITQNGGVISKLGTYQIALAAKKLNKPFYVAAESYKFSRLYPLNQADVPREAAPVDFGPLLPPGIEIVNPTRDFTPPEYISQLITDLGILQPAAVNDELYKMYTNIRMN